MHCGESEAARASRRQFTCRCKSDGHRPPRWIRQPHGRRSPAGHGCVRQTVAVSNMALQTSFAIWLFDSADRCKVRHKIAFFYAAPRA